MLKRRLALEKGLNVELKRDFTRINALLVEEAEGRIEQFPEEYEETLEGFYKALGDAWEDFASEN